MIADIIVSHPHGNPNSYHAARAFAEAGLLRAFEQGFTNRGFASKVLAKMPGGKGGLQRDFGKLPKSQQRQHLLWEGISQLGRRLKASGLNEKISWYDILFCGHDWQVSNTLVKGMNAVYAYEDGAYRTFRAAKRT